MFRRTLLASVGAIALTGAALAADLPSRAPPPVYLPPPPVFTWTGFYAGLNAGYTFGGSNSVDVDTVPAFADPATFGAIATDLATATAASATGVLPGHNEGFIGGGQVGYNLQFANSFVVGIEADIQGTGARHSAQAVGLAPLATVAGASAQSNLFVASAVDYLGTVRGRLGFLLTPALLIFGDGGFAYGGVHQDVNVATFFPPTGIGTAPAFGSFTNTRTGWTAGGGLEWMFAPNWSLKAEYLYYDLGTVTFGVGALTVATAAGTVFTDPVAASTRWNGHIVRAGLNYHFNWGYPAPVVAKY
ncbi:MAG TPA: outer membrane beta-barrel protein [Methylocella sp.]